MREKRVALKGVESSPKLPLQHIGSVAVASTAHKIAGAGKGKREELARSKEMILR